MGVYVPFFSIKWFWVFVSGGAVFRFLGSLILSDGKYYSSVYTDTIDGGFAINRFEVLADLQAPVSTLLYVCFPG